MLGLITSLVCLVFVAAYIFLKRRYSYWKKLGVPGPEPTMIIGNLKDLLSLKFSEPDMMHEWYKKYRNEPYIGYYKFWKPTLFVIDPELVKAITETDCNHFIDRPTFITSAESDAVLDSLFNMSGARWKAKRQLFAKLFNPKQLRELSNLLEGLNDSLVNQFEEQRKLGNEVDMIVVMERHILKLITAFLYSIDTSQNLDRQSKLSELSENFARPSSSTVRKFIFYEVFPRLHIKLKRAAFPRFFWDFFSAFTNDLFSTRNNTKIDRDDLVTLIEKTQQEGIPEGDRIGHHEAVGHVFGFFIAGHHTTMTSVSHIIYQLSLHPQIQEKLRTEVDSVLKGKDTINYDSTREMNYLEAVINESLRLFPLLGVLKRGCTKTYKVNDKLTIPKGMEVILPARSLHTDPKYFPEPEKFIPERFFDPETPQALLMSFGKGPRMCIGKRFAYIAMKIIIAKIISEYIILPGTKTRNPVVFDNSTYFITVHPVDGLHIKLEKRIK
ncbi:unnamed protein product [Nezara viridula]|uniref:Cytochrome P450 n=1 Tax=Nezara viridula TaxID=85310 RepID=A0A9P0H9T5_NEZVI|nr:unnamed protein product [Nezara viridula]